MGQRARGGLGARVVWAIVAVACAAAVVASPPAVGSEPGEVMLQAFAVESAGLREIADIVHEIDLRDGRPAAGAG